MAQPAFVAVDWGTTSFRMWLLDKSGAILAERRSNEGMTTAARTGFADVLNAHLAATDAPDDIPVLICGMAGARQGWIEAGYIDVPAQIEDVLKGAVRIPGESRDIRILPGLAQRAETAPDVIRGEETQLLGALASDEVKNNCLVCMPGTHSKWVTVQDGTVEGFSTYMTGELFEVIAKHSILAHAVSEGEATTGENPEFIAAVRKAVENPQMATHHVFTVRSGQLLHALSATNAKARLSGILIGVEIAGARSQVSSDTQVVLVASGGLGELYKAALAALDISYTLIDADAAVRHGLYAAATTIWPNLKG
jgi:2-dehydro-3-deoxygalactonokinase